MRERASKPSPIERTKSKFFRPFCLTSAAATGRCLEVVNPPSWRSWRNVEILQRCWAQPRQRVSSRAAFTHFQLFQPDANNWRRIGMPNDYTFLSG